MSDPQKRAHDIMQRIRHASEIEGLCAAAIQEAVLAEREACARVAENMPVERKGMIGRTPLEFVKTPQDVADAIRARSKTDVSTSDFNLD